MAILGIHEAQDVLHYNVAPTGVDADEWGTVAHCVQMLLQLVTIIIGGGSKGQSCEFCLSRDSVWIRHGLDS